MAVVRRGGQLDVAKQNLLRLDPAWREGRLDVPEHVLGHHLARGGVEEFRLVLRGDVTDDGAKLGIDDHTLEAGADRLVHASGRVGAQAEQQRDLQVHDEPLGRGHRRRFLQLSRLHAELDDVGAGHDQADAGRKEAIGDPAEEVLDADVPGRHHGRREVDDDEDEQAEETDAEAPEHVEEPSHCSVLLVGRKREPA